MELFKSKDNSRTDESYVILKVLPQAINLVFSVSSPSPRIQKAVLLDVEEEVDRLRSFMGTEALTDEPRINVFSQKVFESDTVLATLVTNLDFADFFPDTFHLSSILFNKNSSVELDHIGTIDLVLQVELVVGHFLCSVGTLHHETE